MNRTASSTLIAALALFVLLGVALAAGCTSTPTGTKPTTAPTAVGTAVAGTAGTVATTLAAASASSGSSSSGSTVPAVGYARLIPFVPKSAGALKLEGDPMGMTSKDSSGKEFSWVTGTYTKTGDDKVQASVQIHDLATAESPLKGMWKSFTAYESTEGYMKSTTVKGFPAWDVYDKNGNTYDMMIGVGDRFIVYVIVEDGTKADLDALVNAIDISGLAAQK
ncbi:MAG: hypothetical protein ABFC89_02595 [Methanospirillum sp.]